jgi:hypothetical protein
MFRALLAHPQEVLLKPHLVYCVHVMSVGSVKYKALPLQALLAWRVDRGRALSFLDLGARRGWVVSTTPRPLYPGKDPVPIVQEAGWAPGPVWTCAKTLAPTGIRSPDRPARNQSLYRMSYPVHYVSW